MQVLNIAEGVAVPGSATTTNGPVIDMTGNVSPFTPGVTAVLAYNSHSAVNGAISLQTNNVATSATEAATDDNWVDQVTIDEGGTGTASIGATGTATLVATSDVITFATVIGYVSVGDTVTDTHSATNIPADTTILEQLTGTAGGTGTYKMSANAAHTVASAEAVTVHSNVLDVTAVGADTTVEIGSTVSGSGITSEAIDSQASGTPGGIGRYVLAGSPQQNASEAVTFGTVSGVSFFNQVYLGAYVRYSIVTPGTSGSGTFDLNVLI